MEKQFPYQNDLEQLRDGEKLVLYIGEKAFIVQLGTDEELEKINQGVFILT
ncbi:hypothetical protein [Paenibacillus sinopodophylli]|uniref:hypothetical protein n=1 Tax=Paenibacillus sinopodophylli TaxID=1837342 RepID=UPI001485D5E1|nr:hypothetical protein [Paenibacillus sinopodophylli]